MKFISKANTLNKLQLKSATIPKFIFFYAANYNKKKIFKLINKKLNGNNLIVRSSCYGEDSSKSSMAGKFLSIANVPKKENFVDSAIKKVIKSYKGYISKKNQVIVQEHVKDTKLSGVITTRDLNTSAPYVCINFSSGKNSNIVTSGKKNTKTIFYFSDLELIKDKKILKLKRLINELKKKFFNQDLDIEFLFDKKNKLYLLQVRKLNLKKKILFKSNDYKRALFKLNKKINKLQIRHHNLLGSKTYFGVMPDWNPAEIIGIKPKPLALSLYQELITNTIWAKNRDELGYRNLRSNRLMTTFLGTPYIDLRVDFNSWIPKNISEKLAEKLVDYYLQQFKRKKSSHDKIEFDIVLTCFNNNISKKFENLKKNGFNKNELKSLENSLKQINKNIINHQQIFIDQVSELDNKLNEILNSDMYYIDKIYWLVEDCKNFGTSSFAGLARSGFVAVDIINSFVDTNIITENEKFKFFESIETISSEIISDIQKLNKKDFIKKHGHLRPNTYEITSLNYRKGYDFLINKQKFLKKSNKKTFKFNRNQKNKIVRFIKKSKLSMNFNDFISFIIKSIQYREKAKYYFTKSINYIFDVLEYLGKRHSIDLDKISFLKIQTIIDMYYELSKSDVKQILLNDINKNYDEFKFNSTVPLPDTIYDANDVYLFERDKTVVNFVTNRKISSKIKKITNLRKFDIKNSIVCIESADPGYDFIFSHKIKGLITMYGGANSHMSIRCMELGIPAAIGVGKSKFDEITSSRFVTLDCQNKTIHNFNNENFNII